MLNQDILLEFCDDRQAVNVNAYFDHNQNYTQAAKSLGKTPKAVRMSVIRAEKRAAKNGVAPGYDLKHQTAPGNVIKRVSTYYKGDDFNQWVIQEPTKQAQVDMIKEIMIDLLGDVDPLPVSTPPLAHLDNDLIVNIPIGDAHIGCLVWGEECGADYDLSIAETIHKKAIDMLIEQTPSASTCAIIDLGDYVHSDNQDGMTSRSGHSLDMDGRYHKVIRCAIRITLYYITQALKKFNKVIYRPEIGNHNDVGAIWMQELLTILFANDPRVSIGNDAGNVFYWQHGECMFMSHHGHQIKGDRLYQLFAKKIMDSHIKTKFRKIYCGHVHHKSVVENAICEIETYRTLAAKDSYSAGAGYHADRGITAETWHKQFGEVSKVCVNIPMIEKELSSL